MSVAAINNNPNTNNNNGGNINHLLAQKIAQVAAPEPPKEITNRSAPLVAAIREKFLKTYEEEKDNYHDEDVRKVAQDDWFVKRFLLARGRRVDDATKMIIEALKWRKSEGIRDLKATYFPDDMFKMSQMFAYAKDKEGNLTLYFRVKYIVKIQELVPTMKKFGNYMLYLVDEVTNGNGITVVVDFQGTGIQNAELDLLCYAITTILSYFPAGINHILIVDLPWILRFCWGVAKSWVPENRRNLVAFIPRKQLLDYIDEDKIPDFMGGTCKIPYGGTKVVPKGCPSTYDFCYFTLGLPPKTCEKIVNIYKPFVDDIEEENQAKDWYQNSQPLFA